VIRSPDLASSYRGAFPSSDSGKSPFRQLHGYWDSPEFTSAFPEHLAMPALGVPIHTLVNWSYNTIRPRLRQLNQSAKFCKILR
jgi:hypothetical protein